VINALTDQEHPCQALADLQTLHEVWGGWAGRTVTFVGDGNNVATSLAQGAVMLGATFHIASPEEYELPASVVEQAMKVARHGAKIRLFRDPAEAVAGTHAVLPTSGVDGQEAERPASGRSQATSDICAHAAADENAVFMQCLPAHRNEEVAADVFESPHRWYSIRPRTSSQPEGAVADARGSMATLAPARI
jgi:ornithine carbamoyltransferase